MIHILINKLEQAVSASDIKAGRTKSYMNTHLREKNTHMLNG